MGLLRAENYGFPGERVEEVSVEQDAKERSMFSLRTREGLNAGKFPQWRSALDRFVAEGLLSREEDVYRLTERGMEVCDTILAEIVL